MITSVVGDIEQEVTINVYITDDATDEQVSAFGDKLEDMEKRGVGGVQVQG